MIIDSHCHLLDRGWVHDDFLIGTARIVTAAAGKKTGDCPDPAAVVEKLLPAIADPTGEKLLASMDSAGIDHTCVYVLDYAAVTGEPGVDIVDQNRMVAEAASRSGGRLIGFFGIDPRREGAAALFEKSIDEWGMRGLKLHPTAGFFPCQEECRPLYEICVERDLPVVIHTGSQPAPMRSRFARPVYVDDVAADFPALKVIMAHAGHMWWPEALLVAGIKPNVCIDISGWQIIMSEHPADFYRMLRRFLDDIGPWRVFFGTDGPFLNVVCPRERWLEALLEPDLSSCPDVAFTPEELEIVAGRGFARLLGIDAVEAR